MAGRRRSQLLAEELASNPSVVLGDRHRSRHVFERLCRLTDELTTNGDRGSLRAAQRAVRIAGRLAGPRRCELCRRPFPGPPPKTEESARAFARLAAALRLDGRCGHADKALAFALATDPTDEIRGDLHRRRALLRVYQERWRQALADARTGLRLATPGRRRALALLALGTVFYYTDRFEQAIKRLEEAVETLDPACEHQFTGALVCYATALTKGSDENARAGLRVCADCRARLKPRHRMQRAKLWWVEGLLHHRLGESRKAWQALNRARLALIALRAAPEVAAITADMARIAPLPHAVANMCHEAGKAIPEYHPLAPQLRGLRHAARQKIPAAAGVLREAASRLANCPPAC